MKKSLILLLIISLFTITACGSKTNEFKKDYEEINGKANQQGKIHRTVTISEDNPFVEVEAKDIVKMIEDKETFYVYFGSRLCPWCRSVIESAIKLSLTRGISKIYYVDIWNDNGEEILRDKYSLDDSNKPNKEIDGTEEYYELLKNFDSLLRDYTLTDNNDNQIPVGEKRIFAPNFVYIEKGVAKKLVTGKSDKLTDPRGELTTEIIKDQETIFDEFFTEVCDEEC